MKSIVQAKEEQYIQILFIRNVYIFLNNHIVKIYRNMRIKILIEDCFTLPNLIYFV